MARNPARVLPEQAAVFRGLSGEFAARDDAAGPNSQHGDTIRHAERGHIRSIAKPMILDSLHSSAPAPTS